MMGTGNLGRQDVVTVSLPIAPEANALLNRSPLALLMAMLLDQQVPMERAFSAPADLARRLGHDPEAEELAAYDPDALVAVFSERPALHRFPKAMAARVRELCRVLVERYDGDAERVWSGAVSGADLLDRVGALPGFGDQKAKIFVALLGKQFGVRPPGWEQAAGDYATPGSRRSAADVVDDVTLQEVREFKRAMKARSRTDATG
jgi:uncharacterized HhH-GPD family protein